ncbi:MAG: YdcF family protein [Myxococcota bacterium]
MVIAITGMAVGAAAFALDRYGGRSLDPAAKFDAIVVAGCRAMPDGTPSMALRRRIERAVELWNAGMAPQIVFTGGVGDAPLSEASVSATYAESLGVPRSAMLLEERSTSTNENARFAAELLPREVAIIVVSDAYHVYRCERVFGRHFESVRGVGSYGDTWPRIKGAVREVVAVAAYAALGRLR